MPVLLWDLTEMNGSANEVAHSSGRGSSFDARDYEQDHGAPLELIRERLLIQKHPRIVELFVELVLHFSYTADYAVQVRIPREHNERCISFA